MSVDQIPEIKVIIATALWLHAKGYSIRTISVPKGEGRNSGEDKEMLVNKLKEAGVPLDDTNFTRDGPDIIAHKNDEIWKIECKGLGKGKAATLRNNGDRALASAVSYFDKKPGLKLGIAWPRHNEYLRYANNRISQALRETLGLTIFVYDGDKESIEEFGPLSDLPPPPMRRGRESLDA